MSINLKNILDEFILEINDTTKSSKETYNEFVKQYGLDTMNKIIGQLPIEELEKDSFLMEINLDNSSIDIQEDHYSNDSIRMYLKEIISVPLLTSEEEKNLFERIEDCNNQIKQITNTINNSRNSQEIKELKTQILKLNKIIKETKEKICNHNLRWVVTIANKYKTYDASLLDLIQEGNIGLMEAIDRFDVKKGFKLSTYATWWIRQSIERYMNNNSRIIRIPTYMTEIIKKIKKIKNEYELKGQNLTDEQLAKFLNTSVEKIKSAQIYINNQFISIDAPVGSKNNEDSETTLSDFIADNESISVEDESIIPIMREELMSILEVLNPREMEIIQLRYGLQGEKPLTLAEIAKKLNVTRERIRQIESKALRKLKIGNEQLSIYIRR